MREEAAKGAELGLTEDEVAFYDSLEVNDSAVKVLGEPANVEISEALQVSRRFPRRSTASRETRVN